jgi:hypothetical protein
MTVLFSGVLLVAIFAVAAVACVALVVALFRAAGRPQPGARADAPGGGRAAQPGNG